MKYSVFLLATLFVSTLSFANPQVSGSTISWPDDGWYQVQRAEDFTTVCEGGRSCDVAAGTYIVINHSSGERFDGVVVTAGSASTPPATGGETISISGNTISWPDDGWYEVQRASDFVSLCSGTRECQVAPGGTYIVINHSTGERFENIELGEAIRPPRGPTPDVFVAAGSDGSSIVWVADGWHQVQNAETFETICEGGRDTDCSAEPGTYIVINHSTGERFENIVVTADGTAAVPGTEPTTGTGGSSLAPVINGGVISWQGDGYFQLQSEGDFVTACEGEINNCAVAPGSYQLVNHTSGQVWRGLQVTGAGAAPAGDDSLSSAQLSYLPTDCLIDTDNASTAFCFSPEQRRFIAIGTAGDVRYDYPLPGSNDSNRIQAILVQRNQDRVCVVADVTEFLGGSRIERSCFTTGGAFIDTQTILQGLPRYGDPVKQTQAFGLNLDGESLRAVSGGDNQIIVQATRYTFDGNGDSRDRNNWFRTGDFAARIDLNSGETLSWQDFNGQTVSALEFEDSRAFITVGGSRSSEFLPQVASFTSGQLDPGMVSVLMPEITRHLHGEAFQTFADEVAEFANQLATDIPYPETTGCILGTDIGCESAVAGPTINISCPAGGSASLTPRAFSNLPFGSARTTGTGETWQFNNCFQTIAGTSTPIRINGGYERDTSSFTSSLSSNNTIVRRFNDLGVTADYFRYVQSGELENRDTSISRLGQGEFQRLGTFTEMIWATNASDSRTLRDARVGRVVVLPRGNSFYQVRDPFSDGADGPELGLTMNSPVNGLGNLRVDVTEPFTTSYTQLGVDIFAPASSGQMEISHEAGESVSISLLNSDTPDGPLPVNFYGEEELVYTINSGGVQTEQRKPSASLYFPWFVNP